MPRFLWALLAALIAFDISIFATTAYLQLASALWAALATLLVLESAVFATTIYLHRALAHRSITVHWLADNALRIILWITTGQSRKEWVAVHRKHHAHTDVPGDPHSPIVQGFWKIQIWNVYYYVLEAKNSETIARWAKDLPDDKWDRRFFNHGILGFTVGIMLAMLIFFGFLGLWGLLLGAGVAGTHFLLYVFVLAPTINGLGHWRGRRDFQNTATNNRILAWFIGGEPLHNNHHAYPSSPKFSMRRGEFDPAWTIICLLKSVGLVTHVGDTVKVS